MIKVWILNGSLSKPYPTESTNKQVEFYVIETEWLSLNNWMLSWTNECFIISSPPRIVFLGRVLIGRWLKMLSGWDWIVKHSMTRLVVVVPYVAILYRQLFHCCTDVLIENSFKVKKTELTGQDCRDLVLSCMSARCNLYNWSGYFGQISIIPATEPGLSVP